MKKWLLLLAGCAVAVFVALLFVDVNAGYTSDQTNSQQSLAQAHAGSAPVGSTLMVHLSGDLTLAPELRSLVAEAIRAKELPFAELRFVEALPADAFTDPFLSVVLGADAGFWTPVYARGDVAVTLHYLQGRPVDPARVLAPSPDGLSANMTGCRGDCTEGMRTVKLNTLGMGLVSRPHMRATAARKIAGEAATLVAAGLPANLDPARWQERAFTLVHEKLGDHISGVATSFARLPGCRGGVTVVTGIGDPRDWRLMYYDAARDAIAEELTRSDVQAKLPGVTLIDAPAFGSGPDGWQLYMGDGKTLTLPAGNCGLSGLRASLP